MNFKKLIGTALAIMSLHATHSAANHAFIQCLSTPIARFDGTVVDAAIATPSLSTLVTAVTLAGLGDTLATAEDITVYAPTDAAFAALEGPVLDAVLGDTDLLTTVLATHVTPGLNDPRAWLRPARRETLSGQSVFYHFKEGMPMVNQSGIACQGVRTDNGIVWIIDSVILPQLSAAM